MILTGCSDAYDIEQAGYVTQESDAFKTAADIGKGMRYVYSLFPAEQEIAFDSFFTDELGVGIANAGQGVNDGSYTFILLAGNENATAIWGRYYGIVNRLNRMLNRIEEMSATLDPEDSADASEIAALNAQKANALALRAYCHYKLFAFFTPDYTDPNGLSIIKFDFMQTDDYNRHESRATVAEIVAFIEDDIAKAKALVANPDGSPGTLTPGGGMVGSGYASAEMMDAILVKMYSMLQTADAYNKLEEAFNNIKGTKSIADPGTYLSMFGASASTADVNEGIFKIDRVSTDGDNTQFGVASAWYPTEVGAAPYMEMGRSLYNELDKLDPEYQGYPMETPQLDENGDPVLDDKGNEIIISTPRSDVRFLTPVHSSSLVATNYASLSQEAYRNQDVLLIGKYPGISNRPLANSIWMFRYTDMLLALAEKRAFEGNTTGTVAIGNYSNVESIIYNIRVNRNLDMDGTALSMPTDFSSKQAAYARILEERRVEFAFEGQRYLDMKRLGVRAGSPGFVRDPQDCASTNACSLEPTSSKLTMPIPRSEMVSNPNMVQNPGY
ncbi:RagB/SusD family nutrient uptake outer membrane protein [Flavobacterium dauae]|uniref:RagB/SusD family nutrient uptake outer membrane protein n=1 Tax=Flavobacterium dauae TaxID=1563479 RepID=UPI0013EC5566|nr:RagB/SusD family nutrient uptake outer membrane protein [Flavobacterium dauae]WLD23475.1 RagB/SusD family nutrient uptake outer membrane protein [Flavobacterium dauae]